jgi:carboxyl-terminal processing protease
MWHSRCLALLLAVCSTLAGPVQASPQDAAETVPLNELRLFAEVFSRIKAYYVDEVDDRELLEDAIRGMLDGLDPHSAFLSAKDFEELR